MNIFRQDSIPFARSNLHKQHNTNILSNKRKINMASV
jgi:hypothetical protein